MSTRIATTRIATTLIATAAICACAAAGIARAGSPGPAYRAAVMYLSTVASAPIKQIKVTP